MATNATPTQATIDPQEKPEWDALEATYNGIVARVDAAYSRGAVTDPQWAGFVALGDAVKATFVQANLTNARTAVNNLSTAADAVARTASGAPAPQPAPAPAPTGGNPTPPAPVPAPPAPQPAPPAPAPVPQPGAPAPTGGAPNWFADWDSQRFNPVANKVDDLVDRMDATESVVADHGVVIQALQTDVGAINRRIDNLPAYQAGRDRLPFAIGGGAGLLVGLVTFLWQWLVIPTIALYALAWGVVAAIVTALLVGAVVLGIRSFTGRGNNTTAPTNTGGNNMPPATPSAPTTPANAGN